MYTNFTRFSKQSIDKTNINYKLYNINMENCNVFNIYDKLTVYFKKPVIKGPLLLKGQKVKEDQEMEEIYFV